jgi:hypothetical protein
LKKAIGKCTDIGCGSGIDEIVCGSGLCTGKGVGDRSSTCAGSGAGASTGAGPGSGAGKGDDAGDNRSGGVRGAAGWHVARRVAVGERG